jgi:hypothetical protein
MIKNKCTICGNDFETKYLNKRVCSFECKQIKQRECSLRAMRRLRHQQQTGNGEKCVVCGWFLTIDTHHEKMKARPLCPNHHSLITRNVVADIKEILKKKL